MASRILGIARLAEISIPANNFFILLKEQKNDINVRITSSMIESIIGEEQKQRLYFLKDSKKLFYPCNGYLVVSAINMVLIVNYSMAS